ncbi:hypothetical protein JL720_16979 [Aureococcus anophagefferens]|nr:hypothetical protein JL720_16979 [Aureococcus anophagefferens]
MLASDVEHGGVAKAVLGLRRFFESGGTMSYEFRLGQLKAFQRMLVNERATLQAAMKADLHKNATEGQYVEVNQVEHECQHAIDHLKQWMTPKAVSTNLLNVPGLSYVHPDPLGVCLVIGAWNFPILLSLQPMIGALAAGNCAVLQETWDHIFFTGGKYVGTMVAEAAAKHLAPCVLELGGKSPCVVDRSASLDVAARRICWGMFQNAGQTCVRPDYLLVHEDAFAGLLLKWATAPYSKDPKATEWFGRLINERAAQRVAGLLAEDAAWVAFGGDVDVGAKYVAPTLLDFGADAAAFAASAAMRDEIFAPVAPMLRYRDEADALAFIKARDKPLSCYVSQDWALASRFQYGTTSGSFVVNDVLVQGSNHALPFGGVGPSGMGAYHGEHSFRAHSHQKAVLYKTPCLDLDARYPPYSPLRAWTLGTVQAVRSANAILAVQLGLFAVAAAGLWAACPALGGSRPPPRLPPVPRRGAPLMRPGAFS